MLSSSSLTGILIAQGVAFVGSLMYFGYKAGRLIEKIDGHEQRILKLEKGGCSEDGDNE